MSKGYCGHMSLAADDGEVLVYQYGCYNLNIPGHRERFKNDESGEIWIDRDALTSCADAPDADLSDDKFQIKNAGGTWQTTRDGVDTTAVHLLFKLKKEYRESGEIPEKVIWFV